MSYLRRNFATCKKRPLLHLPTNACTVKRVNNPLFLTLMSIIYNDYN